MARRLNLFTKPRHWRLAAHSWLAVSITAAYFLYLNASSWESDTDCSRLVCTSQVAEWSALIGPDPSRY